MTIEVTESVFDLTRSPSAAMDPIGQCGYAAVVIVGIPIAHHAPIQIGGPELAAPADDHTDLPRCEDADDSVRIGRGANRLDKVHVPPVLHTLDTDSP